MPIQFIIVYFCSLRADSVGLCPLMMTTGLIDGRIAAPHSGTNSSDFSSTLMARASKTSKAVIPEPSFAFFLRAIGVMLLLVVLMTAYLSLRT
jgi:hypothetical protein